MKKVYIVLGIIALLLALSIFWWNSGTAFLKSVSPDSVAVIAVRNGNTGAKFEVEDRDDISFIVENIRRLSFNKDKISLSYTGTLYTLRFCDEESKVVSEFIVNSDRTIRKDPFFYHTDNGSMAEIIERLQVIEEQ